MYFFDANKEVYGNCSSNLNASYLAENVDMNIRWCLLVS